MVPTNTMTAWCLTRDGSAYKPCWCAPTYSFDLQHAHTHSHVIDIYVHVNNSQLVIERQQKKINYVVLLLLRCVNTCVCVCTYLQLSLMNIKSLFMPAFNWLQLLLILIVQVVTNFRTKPKAYLCTGKPPKVKATCTSLIRTVFINVSAWHIRHMLKTNIFIQWYYRIHGYANLLKQRSVGCIRWRWYNVLLAFAHV